MRFTIVVKLLVIAVMAASTGSLLAASGGGGGTKSAADSQYKPKPCEKGTHLNTKTGMCDPDSPCDPGYNPKPSGNNPQYCEAHSQRAKCGDGYHVSRRPGGDICVNDHNNRDTHPVAPNRPVNQPYKP
jgi:hypothetical protein